MEIRTQVSLPQIVDGDDIAAVISEWDLSARVPERLFVASPPAGAEQIDFLPARPGNPGAADTNEVTDREKGS